MTDPSVARFRNARAGALELALRRAVAHASQYPGAEGRSTASLRSALGFERADVRSEADDSNRPRFRDAETCRPEPRRKDATRQNDVSSRRDDDDDDDDGSPRFALGDVVEADAGVRCLTRFPRERPTPAQAASAFAAATSARVLHVVADAGANRRPSRHARRRRRPSRVVARRRARQFVFDIRARLGRRRRRRRRRASRPARRRRLGVGGGAFGR